MEAVQAGAPKRPTTLTKTTVRRRFFPSNFSAQSYLLSLVVLLLDVDGHALSTRLRPLMASEAVGTWRSEIDVRAEPEQVLDTLTDVGACEAWSPVGFDVDGVASGRLLAGTKVTVSGAIAGRRIRFYVDIIRADSERFVLRA